eukprot:8418878-Pyramimonas_sp.AAC.1
MFIPDYHVRGRLPLPRAGRALRGWRRLAPAKTRRPCLGRSAARSRCRSWPRQRQSACPTASRLPWPGS